MKQIQKRGFRNPLLAGAVFLSMASFAAPATISPAFAETWSPVASERLLRLPGESLEKAVENDFAKSGLAQEMIGVEEQIGFKQMTLQDMQAAVERAEDAELKMELQFQFLEAKRDYLALMQTQQTLRKKQASAKMRLYENLLDKVGRAERAQTPEQVALVDRQMQARQRMERSSQAVDSALLMATAVETSKYSAEYRKNVGAIEQLMAAIQNHAMNEAPSIDGRAVSREEYLRQLVANAQSDLALVEQEAVILGHMAKLVSLDALALAEGIQETQSQGVLAASNPTTQSPSELVGLFTN